MAITKTEVKNGDNFLVNASSEDSSGNEELKAAPAVKSIYLTRIFVSCVAAITVTIKASTTVMLGPFNFAATSGSPIDLDLSKNPLKCTAATSLNVDASGAGVVNVIAEGFTR